MNAPTPVAVPRIRQQPLKKKRWWLALGSGTLWVSIMLHVLLGVGAAYLVVQHFAKKHVDFVAAAPPAPPTEVEHKIEMAKKNSVESAPPDLKRIVTTDISPITLPDVPVVPPTDDVTPSLMAGTGDVGTGFGGGNGTGGDGGGTPVFGAPGGVGLQGVLYDLKQTPDRQPTPIAAFGPELNNANAVENWAKLPPSIEVMKVLRTFAQDWNMDILEHYYKAPRQLVASEVFIPYLSAAKAPEAFHVQDTVQPRRWVVHYQATIIPPESGNFRFVGFADDYMLVRIGQRNVLDASYPGEELDTTANEKGDKEGEKGSRLRYGHWVHMESGQPVNMEVLIGEGPGGASAFFLLIQKRGEGSQMGPLRVFQVQNVALPNYVGGTNTKILPGFDGEKMLFQVAPSDDVPPP